MKRWSGLVYIIANAILENWHFDHKNKIKVANEIKNHL